MSKILHKGKFRTVHQSGRGDYINVPLARGPDGKLKYKRKYVKEESVYSQHRVGAKSNQCIQGPRRCMSLARKSGRDIFVNSRKEDLPALLARCIMGGKGRCRLSSEARSKSRKRSASPSGKGRGRGRPRKSVSRKMKFD